MLLRMDFQTLFVLVMMHPLKELMPIVVTEDCITISFKWEHFSNADVPIDSKDKETVIYASELQLMKKRTRISK